MAEITRQRQGELLRGVFSILIDHPDGLQARHVLQKLEEVVPPNDFEASYYPNNPSVRRYEKIVRFSSITTVKAGWLVKDKGLWSLSDEGQRAFANHTAPEDFYQEALRLYRQWKREQPEPEPSEIEDDTTDAATTVEEAEETAWVEIEEHLAKMNPYDFQNLVSGLLRGMGYHIAWVAAPGPDKGVDVIAHSDPLGINGPRIKAQVKRQQAKTDVQGIRSFMAVLSDEDVGLFVSTGGFTREAENEARYQEKRRLMLVSARRLVDPWVEHYESIPEAARRLLPLKTVHFLAPED